MLTLQQLIDYLTVKPAEALDSIWETRRGETADIVIIDLEEKAKIDPEKFLSKGKNTPFAGWECKGWPVTDNC